MRLYSRKKIIWYSTLLAGACCLVFYALWQNGLLYEGLFHLRDAMSRGEEFRRMFLSYGMLAPLFFVGLQALQVVFAPVPGEASGILGGYLFGSWLGFIYSTIGLTLGSWLAFVVGRFFDDLVVARFHQSEIYHKFNGLIRKGDFVIPFILFLLPGFPKDSLSYLLGVSAMPLRVFLFITLVGRMPGTLMLSLQGANVYQGNYLRLAILLLVSAAVVLPCYLFRKKLLVWLARNGAQRNTSHSSHSDTD